MKIFFFNPYIQENILIFFFFVIALSSSIFSLAWGYDEYAAVLSHLELDDDRFIEKYKLILINFGLSAPIVEFFTSILSFIIVPIRWTYAIGISPLYSIIRIDAFSWQEVKIILTVFHLIISCIGLKLIITCFDNRHQRINIFILLLAFIFLSHPFVYWVGTFTSYSYHIFCFGILLYSEKNKEFWNKNIFGKLSLSRSLIVLFNYQYIPILFFIGVYELIKYKRYFFIHNIYRVWILPSLIILISAFIIMMRIKLLGTDISPELNFSGATDYLIPYEKDIYSLLNSFAFFISRLVDILYYLFLTNNHSEYFRSEYFTDISFFIAILFLLVGIIYVYGLLRYIEKSYINILITSIGIILIQCFMYIYNILPMSPTRHSLIIFMPLILIFSISINCFSKFFENKNLYSCILLILFFTSTYMYFDRYDFTQEKVLSSKPISCLAANGINTIILEPCYLEPVLDNKKIKFIYSCGAYNVQNIPKEANNIALLSNIKLSDHDANDLIKRYSKDAWSQDISMQKDINDCTSKSKENIDSKSVKIQLYKRDKSR